MTNPLVRLGELGQSPWYDYITRDLVATGELRRLIRDDGLRGMTSNPTIFEKAIAGSASYDADIRRLSEQGRSPGEIFEALAVADVRAACDEFAGLHQVTGGVDGQVSLEVSPDAGARHARHHPRGGAPLGRGGPPQRDDQDSRHRGRAPGDHPLRGRGDQRQRHPALLGRALPGRDRVMAGRAGAAAGRGRRCSVPVGSVASFFVSRVDGKVDPLLDHAGHDALRGRIAIANACAAYRLFEWSLGTPRWQRLAQAGARPQRPLWASTSTKDPRYPDTFYVEALVAPRTVNTLPPETFAAYRDHGNPVVRIHEGMAVAPERLKALAAAGIDLAAVTRELEDDGVAKFAASYAGVLGTIETKAGALAVAQGR